MSVDTIMSRSSLVSTIVTVFLNLWIYSASSVSDSKCRESERQALIEFKHSFENGPRKQSFLSNWAIGDCCDWIGVRCSPKTGHVIGLDLSPSIFNDSSIIFGHEISPSLFELRRLSYLDLSYVSFNGQNLIPSFLGNLEELKYLNLSYTSFTGEIPSQLGNLSRLEVLDLRSESSGPIRTVNSTDWISSLSALQILDLSYVDMSLAKDWVRALNNLPQLHYLGLKQCSLSDSSKSLSFRNSSKSLSVLDLSLNSGPISSLGWWLFNHSRSLVRLDLSETNLRGFELGAGFEKMASLEYLDLGGAKLDQVTISNSFGKNMTALKWLSLRNCGFRGNVPIALGEMSSLEYLDLDNNKFGGEIPRSVWEICSLRIFKANNNNITGDLNFAESSPQSKCAHFSLEIVELANNRISGSMPNFTLYPSLEWLILSSNRMRGNVSESLGGLSKLKSLILSDNLISGLISESHFSKLFELKNLDLSSNSGIVFDISENWVPPFQLYYIKLSSCKLGPDFPSWVRTQKSCLEIDMSETSISGPIPNWFWNFSQAIFDVNLSSNEITDTGSTNNLIRLKSLDLSSNQLRGSVPVSLFGVVLLRVSSNRFTNLNRICNVSVSSVSLLDISYNELSGELPDCFTNMQRLTVLSVKNNNLSGKIPFSLGFLSGLGALRLSSNTFTREFPSSFRNLSQLMVLDAGDNRLSGKIPNWIGKNLTDLIILSLRQNLFSGAMPSELCSLQNLHSLDLSSNKLTSNIPSCLGALEGMKIERFTYVTFVAKSLLVTWKGTVKEFENLQHLKNIDLSSNEFEGKIPTGLTELIGLVSLNLSRNSLSGEIPTEIGRLRSLDALDLSNNKLRGNIPSSLATIDRLGVLDLSNNNLSGRVPTGTQIQTRDASAYKGNPGLCGDPLPKKCRVKSIAQVPLPSSQESESFIGSGFGVSLGVGFVVGFCGVCGSLIINQSWRHKYFKYWNDFGYRIRGREVFN